MKRTFLFILSLTMLLACNDDYESLANETYEKTPASISKIRSIETIKGIAKNYVKGNKFAGKRMVEGNDEESQLEVEILTLQLFEQLQNAENDSVSFKKKAKTDAKRNNQDTVMYAVRTGTSTLLIPAFENSAPLFAELEDPNFSWNALATKKYGQDNPLEHLIAPALDKRYWEIFGLDSCKVWGREHYDGWEKWLYKDVVWPKVEVNWDQNSPFNKYCPSFCPAGCVAIATAQALTVTRNWESFNNIPLNYDNLIQFKDNSYIDLFSNEADTIARLIRFIGNAVNMNYTYFGSGAKTQDAIDYFFKPNMNVNGSTTDYRKILKKDKGIVIVSSRTEYKAGEGHAYIIDGFKTFTNYENLYHVNFGWGADDKYNGYFLEGVFLLSFYNTSYEFPYNMKLYSIY